MKRLFNIFWNRKKAKVFYKLFLEYRVEVLHPDKFLVDKRAEKTQKIKAIENKIWTYYSDYVSEYPKWHFMFIKKLFNTTNKFYSKINEEKLYNKKTKIEITESQEMNAQIEYFKKYFKLNDRTTNN